MLLADAAVGVVIVLVGLVVLALWNLFAGAGLGALGVAYLAMVARRYHYWRQLRREAGLDD
ncbi:MAG TPA: hypothetical protein VHA73_11305 [Acidimicrobiales bacterium]|nr:hypothetical protein [Acidimicrobiales bacterium]